MNWVTSHLGVEGNSEELYKVEGFHRKEDPARKLLAKEKKGLFGAKSSSFRGKDSGPN